MEVSMQSNGGEDWLGGLSLDAVVRKAAELERVLSSCKARTVGNGEGEGGRGGKRVLEDRECWAAPAKEADFSAKVPSTPSSPLSAMHISMQSSQPREGEVAMAWQHLTSYIVALEKEVQHYKQLLEGASRQLEVASSIPNHPEDSPYITGLMSHGDSEQTTVEEVATQEQQATTWPQDMKHWDALFEGDSQSRVLLLVFCYLNTAELCSVSRVSRMWYTVSRHPFLWRSVSISETVIPPQVLSGMARWCTQTEKIALHGLMPAMASRDEDLQSYITKTRGLLEASLSSLLAVCGGHTLTTLTITECHLMITERVLWLVSVHCPQLCEFSYSSDEFPPSPEALWSLANGCTHVHHLSLPPIVGSLHEDWFTDSCLLAIGRGWPALRSLCVGGKAITITGLVNVAHSCPHLTWLELVHGPDLNSNAMGEVCQEGGLHSLTTLTLTFTPTSPKALQLLINHCPCLTAVHLHVNLLTYFPSASSDPTTSISSYERVISKLRELQHHPRIGRVFHLHEHYTSTTEDTVT